MGRKRKRRKILPPVTATLPTFETERKCTTSTQANGSSIHSRASTAGKRRQHRMRQSSKKARPSAPTTHQSLALTKPGPHGLDIVPNLSALADGRVPKSEPCSPPPQKCRECRLPSSGSKCNGDSAEETCNMKSSEVLTRLLPLEGWKLASCWAHDCECVTFVGSETTRRSGGVTAWCCCGHRAIAHELVDLSLCDGHRASPQRREFRECHSVNGIGSKSAMMQSKTLVALRRLFAAIRNTRAVGDCGLFQDSQGVGGWGSGWFLSSLGREYLQQARQAVAELNGDLYDASAVERSLSTAEAFMSGDTPKEWAVPDSLPSTVVYKVLGTGVASALDIAYFHVRYSAVSRFDAGSITADTAAAAVAIVPPPEVYFLCLAFHVPSRADLLAMPGIENPALRNMLMRVFDLRIAEELRSVDDPGSESVPPDDELRFPVLKNPFLAVTQSTWLETAVSSAPKTWVAFFSPRFGNPEGTMRGSDPALSLPIRARCDATRDWLARLYAFAVPNRRAVETCQRAIEACGGRGSGIVEVGAGLGYWKWVLENAVNGGGGPSPTPSGVTGGDNVRVRPKIVTGVVIDKDGMSPLRVLAIDKDPTRLPSHVMRRDSTANTAGKSRSGEGQGRRGRGRAGGRGGRGGANRRAERKERRNEYHGEAPAWASVEEGGPELLQSLSADHFPALLLCYPPPSISSERKGGSTTACMGADALGHFSGKLVLYIGEVGGDTGSPRLEEALQADWDMIKDVELPCFSSTANRLMVFTRKGGVLPQTPSVITAEDVQKDGERHRACSESNDAVDTTKGSWSKPLSMYCCAHCGRAGNKKVPLRRCRLTRAASYCSERCFLADGESWRANLQARHAHVNEAAFGIGGIFRNRKLFKRLAV